MFVRIANSAHPDQTPYQKQSGLGVHCLSRQLVFKILEHVPYIDNANKINMVHCIYPKYWKS